MNQETKQLEDLEKKAKTATERDAEYVAWFGHRYGASEPWENPPLYVRHRNDPHGRMEAGMKRDERKMSRKARMRRRRKHGRWGT